MAWSGVEWRSTIVSPSWVQASLIQDEGTRWSSET